MEKDEIELIKRAQKGEREAFAALYEKYFEKIYRYCFFNLRSHEDAQDAVQETFVKTLRRIKEFETKSQGTFQAYLFQIARNIIIDRSRKRREIKIEDFESIESTEDMVEEFSKKQRSERVRRVIDRLDGVERQIIILRYFEEMSYEEISEAVGLKPAALRVRIHRLIKKIAALYEHEDRRRN